jgi:hypothetical protein
LSIVSIDSESTDRDWRRQVEILELEQALLTVPPCPSWCDGAETKYRFVEEDGETFFRHHERRVSSGVYLAQRERNRANVVRLSPVFIDVDQSQGLDAVAALRLASALMDAADLLNHIVAAGE